MASSKFNNRGIKSKIITGTSGAGGLISTGLFISDVAPVFAKNNTSGGVAKFYEIIATSTGDIYLVQHPWTDLTVFETNTPINVELFYYDR